MKKKFFEEDFNNTNINNDNYKKTEEHSEYSNHIYVGESRGKEQQFDRNNPVVKMILLVLGLIAVIGTVYYVLTGIGIF